MYSTSCQLGAVLRSGAHSLPIQMPGPLKTLQLYNVSQKKLAPRFSSNIDKSYAVLSAIF